MFSKVNKYLGRLDIKLTLYYTTMLLIFAFMLCSFLYYRLERNLIKQVDKILSDETHEFMHDLRETNYDLQRSCQIYEDKSFHRKDYPIYFRVLSPSGKVCFSSNENPKILYPPLEYNQSSFHTFTNTGRDLTYRLYQENFTHINGEIFLFQIITTTKLVEEFLENYLNNIMLAIPILLIFSIGCGLLVSMKPRKILKNIIAVTKRITSQNLQERLPVPQIEDEIQDLTVTINSMLDRLERAFNEVKQFTSDVSHELRTPLSSLRGKMEVTVSRKRTYKELEAIMCECIERITFMIKIVNDLFLVSRFDAKKVDLDLIYINLCEILQDLVRFYLPMTQDKDLSFRIGRCDDVVINGDKTKIYQLFSNLLDNAIKFTPINGSIVLSLTAKEDSAQFMVEDSGIGIPEADLPYIFNRFYQVDKSRSRFPDGAGLGLHICEKIAEAHGGDIKVESNKDKGVTFLVTLPIK